MAQLNNKIIFGLKVKQLRTEKGLSFAELSAQTGLSVSYLNEIEKGKKYPKQDKIANIAEAMEVSIEDLTSIELSRNLTPIGDLLQSNFLNELPLELFGIELHKVVEIIANAPTKVGAFISTLVELSRNYALRDEHFYFSAMRAYQELHNNYFPEIEASAEKFAKTYYLPADQPISEAMLAVILTKNFHVSIVENGLKDYPDLQIFRSIFVAQQKKLLLNADITPAQRLFQLGKELAFHYMHLQDRAYTSSLTKVKTFDEVINHNKAAYFSVAILMPKVNFSNDIRTFFNLDTWQPNVMLDIMSKYGAAPDMFFQRLTSILPSHFGLQKMFFMRVIHNTVTNSFDIDKELHLTRRHHPHSNGLREFYCRRWIALALLNDLEKGKENNDAQATLVGVQRSKYFGTQDEYLCFTLARFAHANTKKSVSVTIGILLDAEVKKQILFWNDPNIQQKEVNQTCERCPIQNCTERASAPTVIYQRQRRQNIQEALKGLLGN
jgi:XRE family transcriptional regulator, fatty acid utilization regulator